MIDQQIRELRSRVRAFGESVRAVSSDAFLTPLGKWTPRDIVAHLIGWNRHVVRGSEQILNGELPFYDIDPGEDYAHINAALIRQYDETDRDALLEELDASTNELAAFLESLDPAAWDKDFGSRHGGEVLTVQSTVDDLLADYTHHKEQLDGTRK